MSSKSFKRINGWVRIGKSPTIKNANIMPIFEKDLDIVKGAFTMDEPSWMNLKQL